MCVYICVCICVYICVYVCMSVCACTRVRVPEVAQMCYNRASICPAVLEEQVMFHYLHY